MSDLDDQRFLAVAIALGQRAAGRTWPNPSVGCVIVKDGIIVGRGWTQPGGRPHAEVVALNTAGARARGATAYVSLEPCAHFGKTPPCTQALTEAGIARVVTSLIDPDPRVNGRGLEQLRAAGIAVDASYDSEAALALHAGYIARQTTGRPAFTLKLAQSLDGKIAARNGESQWITGPLARRYAHLLRARHDAILVGSGTALADDPMLDCRIGGMESRSPIRIILDRRLRLPATSKLAQTAQKVPVWLITEQTDPAKSQALADLGVRILAYPQGGIADLARLLGQEMLTTVMIEGGSTLAAAFMRAELIDRLHVVTAGKVIGGDGLPAIGELSLDHVDRASNWIEISRGRLGGDNLVIYRPQSANSN